VIEAPPSPPEPDGSYGTPPWRGENRKGTGSGVCFADGSPGWPDVTGNFRFLFFPTQGGVPAVDR